MDQNHNNLTGTGRKSRRRKVYSLLGGAALAAAVTLGGNAILPAANVSYAQTAPATTPAGSAATPAAGSANTAPANNTNSNGQQSFRHGPQQGGKMDGRRGENGGPNGASGTISAVNGNTLTLKQGNVIVIQATLNANTVYTEAGKTISLSDLKVGEEARVRETKATDGTLSISEVEVILNHAQGTISAVDASSLTLTKADNSSVKINLAQGTSFTDLGKAANLSDLKTGMKVEAAGTLNADGSLNAEVINIQHDHLGGTITAINGNSVTVQVSGKGGREASPGKENVPGQNSTTPGTSNNAAPAAASKTITVSGSTVFQEADQTSQLSQLAVGDRIEAAGTLSTDSSTLAALQVRVGLPHYQGQVSSVNGATIVIQDRNQSRTITVNSNTKYLNGQTAAALTDVKAGANISVEGKVDASGNMTAALVQLGRPNFQGQKGGHER